MSKRRRIIIFAIIILVVAGASAGLAIFLSRHHSGTNSGNTNGNNQSSGPVEQPADQKADDADKVAAGGDVNAGVQQLDDAIKSTTNSSDQYIYYSHKATLLFNDNDLAGALEAALAAYNLKKTSDSAAFVGQIADQKGDKATALDYYKQALSLIDPNDPFANEDKSYYQGIVDNLQGGK